MSAKPSEPQAVPGAKDAPSTPQWLFLFYKWVTGALAGLFPGTAGNVIYSDGAGGVANEDAFNYAASTNTLNLDSILVDVGANVGEMGSEGSGITIGGSTYTAHLKVSDINDSHPAEFIIHRHSTTLPAALIAARSNSAGSSHAAVTSGQSLFQIYAVGHDGTDYAFSSAIDFAVDGTPGSNDMPGRIGFFTAAGGGQTLTERFRVSNFGGLGIGGANFGTSGQAFLSAGSAAAPAWTTLLSTHISDFTEAAQDVIGALLVDSSSIGVTYDDGANSFTVEVIPGGVDHGGLAGLADDDHTQYVLRSILTTNGDLFTRAADVVARLGVGTDAQVLTVVSGAPAWADAAGGGGATKDIAQVGHGFSVGHVVYLNGTTYTLADADTEATAEVVGIVSAVADADNFTLLNVGYVSGLSGLTAGTVYFLSATAGALTATEPSTAGQVSKPLLIADSTTSGYFFNMRGHEIDATGSNGTMPMTPQGRLTLTTATPVMTAEAAAQTTVYYTPYVGSVVPLYDGTNWTNTTFAELSIAMAASANWAANSNFDLFVYNDGGTLRLVTGAAWTNDTTRAEALVRTNGIWLNNASFTGRYGAASTVSIAASRATYVGTMRTTASTGTTTWELGGLAAGGDPGFLYVWNCYNRVPTAVGVGDTTDSWTYSTTTVRASDNSTSMRVTVVRGLNEDSVSATFTSLHTHSAGAAIVFVGLDSTSAMVGAAGNVNTTSPNAITAHWHGLPGLGLHYLQALEYSSGATGTFYGDAGGPTIAQSKLHVTGMF